MTQQKTIKFKSYPDMFEKEKSGKKRNTIRVFDSKDIRENILLQWIEENFPLDIIIKNTNTEEVFGRKVTDVSVWNGMYIISW